MNIEFEKIWNGLIEIMSWHSPGKPQDIGV
jgi:hypothetical protein